MTDVDSNFVQQFVYQTGEINPNKAITVHIPSPRDDWDEDVIYQVDQDGFTLRFRSTDDWDTVSRWDRNVRVEFEAQGITVAQFLMSGEDFRSLAYALEESA